MEDISRIVSLTLDHIGYSKEVIMLRRNYWRKNQAMFNKAFLQFHLIIAGSKAEGITSLMESDIDFMYLFNDVICSDNAEPFLQLPDMTVFQTDMTNTSPGYTKLKLRTFNGQTARTLEESLFREDSGDILASGTLFASHINRTGRSLGSKYVTVHDLSGPATPLRYFSNFMVDNVSALPCFHPEILHSYRTRHRQHGWPPLHIIEDESSAVCQLVPIGYKGSCDQWKEWRFCFIHTEMSLTDSLNDSQLKLYIVLKMIAKNILKCVSNEISSYIMKNITYWMSERLGSHSFREDQLIELMLRALRFLKVSIENYCLPYYMIPGRNLLAERLEPHTRRALSDLISQLLDEGPRLLLRCTKLQMGMTFMYTSPEVLVDYRNRKELFELFYCLLNQLYFEHKPVGLCKEQLIQLVANLFGTLFPDWRELRTLGDEGLLIALQRLTNFLS